ncbi:MAG: hypothetical protein KIT10_14790 [Flavobacteriales bacterium]|nr:hypothetical protein [Flavobacteriales bacterium]
MPSSMLHGSLTALFVLLGAHPSDAQQLSVHAGRLDTFLPGVARQEDGGSYFRRGEIIELEVKIDAVIDSISMLEGRRFIVLSRPVKGRSDSWRDGVHIFAEWRYYQIKPRKRGRLVVPAMTVYSCGIAYRTEPLELVIGR